MASRPAAVGVSQAQKQRVLDGAEPVGKQKAPIVGARGKNGRALKNISNIVTTRAPEGKVQPQVPQPHINRPITRSFGAQLLAKAANDKKPIAIPKDKPIRKAGNKTAKELTAKPKPLEVIEINSGNERESENQSETSITSCSKPAKKRVHTLTSVLTARSKVACGITDKPAELVHDIDSGDGEDQLAVVDYIEDIYMFYKQAEHSSRPDDYMSSQVEINAKMRAILADWLIEVHHRFELMPETLYLTFYVIDRYLSIETTIARRELQLVGVAAMLIASKYEEIWAPEVNDFICISDRSYSREQILAMEKGILNKLEWNLTVPTPYMFLVRFLKAARSDKEMEHMVFFFAELGLVQYSMITYCPSMVAASAIFAAQCTLEKSPLWSETLKFHTGFSKEQLLDCTQILINSHFEAPQSKQTVVYKKYSHEKYGAVALRAPATKLIEEMKASRI